MKKNNKFIHPINLTPLNLPKRETSDSLVNKSQERNSPPLESLSRFIGRLGEVKIMRKTPIIGFCMMACILLSGLRSVSMPEANWDLYSKKYTYHSLTGYELSLFEGFIASAFPEGKTVSQILTGQASLRSETRLAQALLFRNNQGDRDHAVEILKWILKNQHTDEASENFGLWKTNVEKDRLDQNWREFIGCDLIIIYQEYKHLLPPDVLADIRTGLIRAAKGALKRNVGADYTNISIMSAFLMDYAGNTFQMEDLKAAGLKKALEISHLWHRHQTFSEYNSPTYYGVTLIGLALWRELASEQIKEMGIKLEATLWNEIATNYNPKLKNLVGPYFRSYGMDMKKYCSITGIWIAIALDDGKLAPLPVVNGAKMEEMSNLSPILHLGLAIPKTVMSELKVFTPRQKIDRMVFSKMAGDTLKHITAIVNSEWMMGGLWGNRRIWNQVKAGTIHWNNPEGESEWLMVPGDGKTNVRVTNAGMYIYLANEKSNDFSIYVYAKELSDSNFTLDTWKFPSMKLGIQSTLKRNLEKITEQGVLSHECEITEEYQSVMKITFQIPPSWKKEIPLIEIIPSK